METIKKDLLVNIEGWEMEVMGEPQKVQHELWGEMIQLRGIWLTEPERGLVTVLTRPEHIYYLEITETPVPPQRRAKITPLRRCPISRDEQND